MNRLQNQTVIQIFKVMIAPVSPVIQIRIL